MSTFKSFIAILEKNKSKIMKFLIICVTLKFCISVFYRMAIEKESRNQFMVMLIFFSEFCGCLLVSAITENFKLVKIYTGKGLIYILISIIYMSPSLGSLQNYSAYALLFVGTISIVCDCSFNSGRKISSKFVQPFPPGTEKVAYIRQDLSVEGDNNDNYRVNTESPLSNNDGLDIKDGREIKINNDMDLDRNDKQEAIIPSNNPYDIPDDF